MTDIAKRVAVVLGTRPEAIKLAPVIQALSETDGVDPILISTGQHRQMLDQALEWFDLQADVELNLMTPGQLPSGVLSIALTQLDRVFHELAPAAVLVQGDTTTALAAALSAFHQRIPVGHVEAGLRTYDLTAPFPEEGNRAMIGRIATWHFAPTDRSVAALKAERVPGEIIKTGNTVVDALLHTASRPVELSVRLTRNRLVLITGHRRENFGGRFEQAFLGISDLARAHPDTDFVYPVHLNPSVRDVALRMLADRPNVQLIDPLPYPQLVALMRRANVVLTDSGGIQEEAPTFGVPVAVMRDTTERPEAVDAGLARLVGTTRESIFGAVSDLLTKPKIETIQVSPYGDGHAGARIAQHLRLSLHQ